MKLRQPQSRLSIARRMTRLQTVGDLRQPTRGRVPVLAPPAKAKKVKPPAPAWELVLMLRDRTDPAAEKTSTVIVGCLAYTRGEARAKLRQLINERHGAKLDRLPPGLSPVRSTQPVQKLKVIVGDADRAELERRERADLARPNVLGSK